MAGFRRAQLRGSDELFRSTAPSAPSGTEEAPPPPAQNDPVPATVAPAPAPARPARADAPRTDETLLVRLDPRDVETLAEAVQHLKFPGKASPRPSVDEFERLESLRQRLLDLL